MADNVTVDNGTGTDYVPGTDERTIATVAVHVQRVVSEGGSSFATAQVTPTAAAATLSAARETRKDITIYNATNMTVFIGPATVTTANGFGLVPGAGMTIRTTALLQNIVASVTGLTGALHYVETFDA